MTGYNGYDLVIMVLSLAAIISVGVLVVHAFRGSR